jgi:predicted nuclease of predicted toxin-antitoxin system
MKFLIDAQLPRRLTSLFKDAGAEAIHTLDLPLGNRTPDTILNELSRSEHFIVVTKDVDFVNTFHLSGKPWKLFLIATGNIKNRDLETLLKNNLENIVQAFEAIDFIELNRTNVIFHL